MSTYRKKKPPHDTILITKTLHPRSPKTRQSCKTKKTHSQSSRHPEAQLQAGQLEKERFRYKTHRRFKHSSGGAVGGETTETLKKTTKQYGSSFNDLGNKVEEHP